MKQVVRWVSVSIALLIGVWWWLPEPGIVPSGAPAPLKTPPPKPGVLAPVAAIGASPSDPVPAYVTQAAAVQTACDLPVRAACEGSTCAGVLTMPDMDHVSGWLRLLGSSPRFVASTALRDLGIPVGALPCGHAVDALLLGSGVLALELPDGTELWCATGDEGPAGRALCGKLAGVQGFADPDIRVLRLHP